MNKTAEKNPENYIRRKVLIIGAGGSLGREISLQFGTDDYPLILAGRSLEKLHKTRESVFNDNPKAKISCYTLDYTDPKTLIHFAKKIKEKEIELSIVINTAAGFYKGKFQDMDTYQLNNLISSNYTGIILLLKELFPVLKNSPFSDIINITSISSATTLDTSRSSSAHIATKSALHLFDNVLSRELSQEGFRITTIAPSTLAKKGREGIPMDILAKLVKQIVELPPVIRIESLAVFYTGYKN
ncbi:MAG: SDR family NAD(P)-dependent oxidoreductase [Candidatus Hodarchaeota archaeon]